MFRFKEALYYAVREDFNQSVTPGYIDEKYDNLIREAIVYVESNPEILADMARVEVEALARAASRRKLEKKGSK